MPRPLALVTGASAGIGSALARRIAADGYDLVLVARREDRLRALADELPVEVIPVALDLTERDAPAALQGEVAALGRPLDVLVNNAGFGHAGPFAQAPLERQLGMIDLNVRTLVELTHRLLPAMVERSSGAVLNVASTAAYLPGPNVSVYYATKAFVLSFSEALWQELHGTGVTVTALCPGPTRSEFGSVSGMDRSFLFKNAKRMSAERVAAIGWRGTRAGRRVVVPGLMNKVGAVVTTLMPSRLLLPIVERVQR
ncbi:SDR family NAD(P)-dependent oxidoreductase [Acuticoccus sp.]|uniref:SDR family NAD(P)-dependent oxidoreductase n=1 Tax=Acuticoccus sp. TaxID=1904378 RepID=UPI003B523EA7